MKFDERGREVPDSTPVEVPLHLRRRDALQDQIRRLIRTEMSRQAAAQGMESFEEADDFDVDGEDEFVTQYEMTEMQEEANMLVPEPKEAGEDGEERGSRKSGARPAGRGRSAAEAPEGEEGDRGVEGPGEGPVPAKGAGSKAAGGGTKSSS